MKLWLQQQSTSQTTTDNTPVFTTTVVLSVTTAVRIGADIADSKGTSTAYAVPVVFVEETAVRQHAARSASMSSWAAGGSARRHSPMRLGVIAHHAVQVPRPYSQHPTAA